MQLASIVVLALFGFSVAAPTLEAAGDVTRSNLEARNDDQTYDHGYDHPSEYHQDVQYDDGSWYPGKYPDGSEYDDGSWYPGKYDRRSLEKRDDNHDYNGDATYDDGSWYPGKYPDGSEYDDGLWYPGKYDGGSKYDDKKDDDYKSYDKEDSYGKDKCPSRHDAVPFNRMCYPEGMGTSSIIGYFFNWQVSNTVPLYAVYNSKSKDYFYTTDKEEKREAIEHKGYESKDIAGYIFPESSCGCVALFRLYDFKSCQHFYTTSEEEKQKAISWGYKFEGIEGYVFQW